MRELCRNDDNRLLKIEIFDALKNGNKRMLGSVEFTLKEIVVDEKKAFQVYNKKIVAGTLTIHNHRFLNRYTFLDYIHGGCTISLMVAMDCTLSNKLRTDKESLHYFDPDNLTKLQESELK